MKEIQTLVLALGCVLHDCATKESILRSAYELLPPESILIKDILNSKGHLLG